MRRFVTLALSFSLVLGLSAAGSLFAQEKVQAPNQVLIEKNAVAPPADTPAADAPKADAPAADAPAADAPKPAAKPAADAPLPSIPPEVEAKLEAARKAVAELIVAAQDAGLVETSIEPPPILDILITGRATDLRTLNGVTKESPEAGVSPEVFGAWYTGYGKAVEGITAEKNVRIIQPAKGLNDWYAARAAFLNKYIEEARQAKPAAEEKKEEAKPAPEEKKPDAPADEAKPADEEKKPEEPKTEDAPKTEEAKPAAEEKKEDAAPAEEPKAEEAPKADDAAPAEEPKAEEAPKV